MEIQLYQDSIQACYIPWMDVDHQQVYGGDWSNCGHTRVSLIIIGKTLPLYTHYRGPVTECQVKLNYTDDCEASLQK